MLTAAKYLYIYRWRAIRSLSRTHTRTYIHIRVCTLMLLLCALDSRSIVLLGPEAEHAIVGWSGL